MAMKVDKEAFFRRAKHIYSSWKVCHQNIFHFLYNLTKLVQEKNSEWSKLDALVFAVGQDEEVVYSKSNTLQSWLLGYELPDTILVMTESNIFFLASKKKIEFLRPLESNLDSSKTVPDVRLLVRDKEDKDKRNISKLVESIKSSKKGKSASISLQAD